MCCMCTEMFHTCHDGDSDRFLRAHFTLRQDFIRRTAHFRIFLSACFAFMVVLIIFFIVWLYILNFASGISIGNWIRKHAVCFQM